MTSQIYFCEVYKEEKLLWLKPIKSHIVRIVITTLLIIKSQLYLKSTSKKKNFDANFLPEKICPVSGFAPNFPVFQKIWIPSFNYIQNDVLSQFHMSMFFPGRPDPVFGAKIRFFNILIFKDYHSRGMF